MDTYNYLSHRLEVLAIRTRHLSRLCPLQPTNPDDESPPTMAAATAAAMVPDTFNLSVLVFKGDPIDWQRYRHTALCFRPASSSPSPPPTPSPRRRRRNSSSGNETSAQAPPAPLIIHVIGASQEYEQQAIEYEPRRDPNRTLVRDITVGKLRKAVTKQEVISMMETVSVDNDDSEFNCQTWIEKALKVLSDNGWVTKEEYNDGVDGMVETIIEAEEEPEA